MVDETDSKLSLIRLNFTKSGCIHKVSKIFVDFEQIFEDNLGKLNSLGE